MLLFLSVGCVPDKPGIYEVQVGALQSDCSVPPTANVDSLGLSPARDSTRVSPFGEECPGEHGEFACALGDYDSSVDYEEAGLDAWVKVDTWLRGAWGKDGRTVTGQIGVDVSCDGADCATIEDATPEACSTHWDWTGEWASSDEGCTGSLDRGASAIALGEAPWDPVLVAQDNADGWSFAPVLYGDAYAPAALVVDDVVDAEAGLWAFTAEHPDESITSPGTWLWPGVTRFDASADSCLLPAVPTFNPNPSNHWEIGHPGRDPAFSAEAAVGSWDVSLGHVLVSGSADGSLLAGYLGVRLDILAVHPLGDGASEAEFRIVSDESCVALQGQGHLSATGELTWSMDRLEAATDPQPMVLYSPRLRFGFDSSGGAAGGEASLIADVRFTVGTDHDLCDAAVGLGGACEPCPDDGEPFCISLATFAATATPTDTVTEDLPLCGVDLSDTGSLPDWDIDVDCGTGTGTICAASWFVLFIPALARRRHRL